MFTRMLLCTAALSAAAIAGAPGALAAGPGHAALICRSGQIMAVKVTASPATVPSGTPVQITAQGLNCTGRTLNLTEVDRTTTPCSTTSGTSPDTFTPHQSVTNMFPWPTSNCPGTWRFSISLYQGTSRVGYGATSWTVTA